MTRLPAVLAALAVLSAPASADSRARLTQAAADSYSAAAGASPEALKGGSAVPFSESQGVSVVRADLPAQFSASQRTPAITNAQPVAVKAHGDAPPEPKKPGFIDKAGATLKEYTPHLLTAGIGGAAGAVAAKVAGFGLLGGIAAGAGIGLAAMYLFKKGETGASIGAASFGLAGLALGGPLGGLAGAVVGGLGGWLLGKFFS